MRGTVMTVEEATALLRENGNYGWLLDAPYDFFTVEEVSNRLRIGENAVRSRLESKRIPGASYHGQGVGWRIPKNGLILYVASTIQRD